MNKFEINDYIRLKYAQDYIGVIIGMRYECNKHYVYRVAFIKNSKVSFEDEIDLIKLTEQELFMEIL